MICGRKTYDDSLPWWEADGPAAAGRLPVFVVTHEAPQESPENGVYTLMTSMFEGLGCEQIALEPLPAIETPEATHLRYRVVR